ncbi:hypothetical protein [Alkalilacustris brevis]|uniref:hypothetical protein n=1 Tax=Alkalilacustris brevis TaxID=2026338 RepID=UPI001EE4895B|nr:hypothetical protein [Alkalilacustris brevis]
MALALAQTLALGLPLLTPGAGHAEAPLSAIDWLSESIMAPPSDAVSEQEVLPPPVPGAGEITVEPIDAPSVEAVGLVSAEQAGLPRDFWAGSTTETLTGAIAALPGDALPALRDLSFTILLTEFDPPDDTDGQQQLFLARVDRLLDFGGVEQALALIENHGADNPDLFRRWFDAGLLLGREEAACDALLRRTGLEPSYPARIFCFARAGHWSTAALTLRSARALEFITEAEEELLARFLDPELFDHDAPLPEFTLPSPLVWRLLEALGDAPPTRLLPPAFSHAELRSNAAWRNQIEAAERLTRAGALPPNRLLGLYTARRPAASGGVWDRAEAVQQLDRAIQAQDGGAASRALPQAWARLAEIELEATLARLFAEDALRLALGEEARALAFRMGLLTPAYADLAAAHDPATPGEAMLKALALGGEIPASGQNQPAGMTDALRDGLTGQAPDGPAARLLERGETGAAVLTAISRLHDGAAGDLRGVAEGLAVLVRAGLEDHARRAALQLVLLDRRG